MHTRVFSPTYPTWALVGGGLQGQPAKLYVYTISTVLHHYTISTQYLHDIYTVSTRYLPSIYTLPRFGLVPCLRALHDIGPGEEIFVWYGYDLDYCPQWYMDAWDQGDPHSGSRTL